VSEMELNKSPSLLICTFFLGEAKFGIDAFRVQEVILLPDCTRVHRSPDYVMGLVNLRGRIATVIDLATRIGLDSSPITDESRVIIFEKHRESIGLLVDRISDVVETDRNSILPAPSNVAPPMGKFVDGIFNPSNSGTLVALLKIDPVLQLELTAAE
jgi:purine-binding chemotaxis protein CheW